jgi:hypothetical protein
MIKISTIAGFLILFILIGCKSLEVKAMEFCPIDIEIEARETLGLGDSKSIKMSELLKVTLKLKLVSEVAEIDDEPLNCQAPKLEKDHIAYMVYGGHNETKDYVKAYLVVANSIDSEVLYIDKRYMYKTPKPF